METDPTKYYFVWQRFGGEDYNECDTLADAFEAANYALNHDDCWPEKIMHGAEVLWEQSGPNTTADTLKAFAEQHGLKYVGPFDEAA